MSQDPDPAAVVYDAADLKVLGGVGHVRQNPGMYVGSCDARGIAAMVVPLVVAALDGHARTVRVEFRPDGSFRVEDDGTAGVGERPTVEDLSTFRFPRPAPGRWWFEYAFVNALSEWFRVEWRDAGRAHRLEFRRGVPADAPAPANGVAAPGLAMTFRPDPEIFGDARLAAADVRDRLRAHALLRSGTRVTLIDEAGCEEQFEAADGVRAYVELLDAGRPHLHADVIVTRGEAAGVRYEVGLRWSQDGDADVRVYVNGERTPGGGTPETGLRAAVTRTVNGFVRDHLPGVRHLKGYEVRAGLTAFVSVWLAEPHYFGATKTVIDNPEARAAVESGVAATLGDRFRADPAAAERVVRAALARPTGVAMTEAEWLACADPRPMLRFVDGTGGRRRAVLFALACCRPAARTARRDHEVLTALEPYADAPPDDPAALQFDGVSPRVRDLAAAIAAPDFSPADAVGIARRAGGKSPAAWAAQAELVRDIFGNPFRPAAPDPAWLTPTVAAVARGIHDARTFHDLPVLADALEDAGCDCAETLAHCRGDGPHARGCWVLDWLLGGR